MMSSVMMPADSTTRDKRRRRREEKRAKRPKKERVSVTRVHLTVLLAPGGGPQWVSRFGTLS